MPKTTVTIKVGDRNVMKPVQPKFRIGPRKSGSAHLMSNDDLLQIITDPNQTRYAPKAKQVLKLRGVSI